LGDVVLRWTEKRIKLLLALREPQRFSRLKELTGLSDYGLTKALRTLQERGLVKKLPTEEYVLTCRGQLFAKNFESYKLPSSRLVVCRRSLKPVRVRMVVRDVEWKCRRPPFNVNKGVIELEWCAMDRTVDFIGLERKIREVAGEREWIAEDLVAEIASLIEEKGIALRYVKLRFSETDKIGVEVSYGQPRLHP